MSNIDDLRYKVLSESRNSLTRNQDCFIALWAMQQWCENPKIDFSQYKMCYQSSWHSQDGVERFWMEKKSPEILIRDDKNTVVDCYKKTLEALEQRVAGLKVKIEETNAENR